MRHATDETIKALAPLLSKIRNISPLKEKKPGVYYLKSKAFLHFHEHEGEIFADVRLNPPDFDRLPATTKAEQSRLLKGIQEHLK